MNNKYINSANRQRGISLVELMIGMVVGLFVIAGVVSVFDNARRGYRFQEGMSQVQEQGRFAMEFLATNLRVAGYPANVPPAGNKLEGTDGATDSVTVRFDATLDCRDTATGGTAVNQFRINNNNLECSGDGVTWDVFVENIEDMQLLYGEDTDADGIANRYLSASDGPNWSNVVTARAAILVRSMDLALPKPESYVNLAGTTVTPTDSRMRRQFVTTINVRN